MDSARLPAYRSSYLLRFHPYPREKPSTRERIAASTLEESYKQLPMNLYLVQQNDISLALDQAIHGTNVQVQLRQRHLSMPPLVVDLALLSAKASSS